MHTIWSPTWHSMDSMASMDSVMDYMHTKDSMDSMDSMDSVNSISSMYFRYGKLTKINEAISIMQGNQFAHCGGTGSLRYAMRSCMESTNRFSKAG